MDLFKFRSLIAGLDEATLRSFNSVLVAQINASTRLKSQAAAQQFKMGDLASFVDKAGVKHTMRIERFNAKTVSGKDITTGMPWRVSPGFLTLVGAHPAPAKTPLFGNSALPAGTVPMTAPVYGAGAGSF